MDKNIFTAIEIGEKNIKVVVANYAYGQLSVCAANSVKTQGISNGEIVSRKDVLQSLELAIGPIKEQGFNVSTALLVLPSSKMKIYRKRSTIEIVAPDKKVTARDVRELKQTFQRSTIPLDEMIVNIIPLHYLLDDQLINGYNPIGMTASKVQFDASVVTLPKIIARGYVDLIQDLGIEVQDAVVSTYALYSLVPTPKQKENGWYIVNDKIECVCDGKKENLKYQPELVNNFYVQNIHEYLEYLENSQREKDKLRIPIVKQYINKK